ncbi:MAG TPA: CpsB/CapC family capsule biosynthesis tyrosine phosphatase [Gemmatimonadaceae bacterium]|nr:CpsB/CapC family capsule biosynthesis tyrosine phosphatase [Gemmatimonadaceae bacterium]
MIDIHTHLLPGVDDGSPSIAASVPVLQRFGAEGVELVVCTPHLDASRAHAAPHDRFREILSDLAAAAPAVPRLAMGWEIMLDVPGADLRDPRLGLDGSTARLVEFARGGIPPNAADELERLRDAGVVPVVAHPERYWGCTRAHVAAWRSAGARIQMDVTAILGSRRMSKLSEELLADGLVDCFASDTHVDHRSLAAARQWLDEVAPAEAAALLTRDNAHRLLANDDPLPVPSIECRKGVMERLRELVFGH